MLSRLSTKLSKGLTPIAKNFSNSAPVLNNAEQSFDINIPYKLHKLDEMPPLTVNCTNEEALVIYRKMMTIRRLEMAAANLYKEKHIRGFCHLYSGQEACAVGIDSSLRQSDGIITSYRAHGWTFLRGGSILGVLAELTGRKSGVSEGKGGSMHMYGHNFYGGNGIVGAQVPLGAGVAFANKYNGTDDVCMTLFGDGAMNQGQIFETFNMSKLWDLPVIYVIENNGYGMGTSADRASASCEYYTRGDYIPGIWVDGMDVLGVKAATKYVADYCRSGRGPIVMELATYRYSGHSMSDPGTSYRTRDEVQDVRKTRDPITGFKERILTSELVTPEQLKAIDVDIKQVIDEATKKAKIDGELPPSALYTNVHSQILPGTKIRGADSMTYGTV